jgi:hypothetical protein
MPPKASRSAKTNDVPFQMTTRHRTYELETPISTDNQASNDSTDEDQPDKPATMENIPPGLLRQIREEITKQVREKIRRETRTEQQHQSPTQQLHHEINQNAPYDRNADHQQDLIYRERQDIRKLAKLKFGNRKFPILNG